MRISETSFSFLLDDCMKRFGKEAGIQLYNRADEIYSMLVDGADYKGSDVIRNHLQQKLFPPMAYYKALLEAGHDDGAIDLVRQETRKTAEEKKASMAKMAALPFSYAIYRAGVHKFMEKNFPDEGWETQWVRCDSNEIHFNLSRCIYHDLCKEHGCPELCTVYCENDDISFSGLLPKIRFERSGTLADGAHCCDFHFLKNRDI